MASYFHIPEPFLFNPLKHHLGFIKEFASLKSERSDFEINALIRELKHIGSSVMDVYTGSLSISEIYNEVKEILLVKKILQIDLFCRWIGLNISDFRIISLSDGSQWTLKFKDNKTRFVHFFPARNSKHTFRVKSNTLKSAVLYYIFVGKDLVLSDDINSIRPLLGLSPIKDIIDSEAITEMVEILRN